MAEMHDLVAPYALDALDPDEAIRFEAHLETCESCRGELTRLTEGAADLAESVVEAPPARVKVAVLDAISDERTATVTSLRPRRNVPWLVAGAAAAVALVFFGLWMTTISRLDDANRVAAVYEASDATVVEVDTANGPARFVYSPSLERGVFNGGALADLSESDVYQLWLIGSNGPVSAGTLMSGETNVLVETTEPGLTLAMTIEPSPGVDAPTTEPLFAAEL
ncbi:MAG: anti-sigma factor [Acidimicrobiia bacterium]